jgi:hypothetical protein
MDAPALELFENDGSVLLRGFLSPSDVADLRAWADDVCTWPAPNVDALKYTLHHETVDGVRRLCRVENFTPLHGGLAGIAERACGVAGGALGCAAALFKEKLNVKPPGGRGYGAHYDGPSAASLGFAAQTFVTVQIAIDAQTVENGCLQVARPRSAWPAERRMVVPVSGDPDAGGRVGAIADEIADAIDWTPVECAPGDALVFDHWTPHWSGPNRSAAPRRTLYFIFSRAEDGDWHDAYYSKMAAVRAAWAQEQDAKRRAGGAG